MMWWDGGHGHWGAAMMIAFWGAIVAIAYVAFRGRAHNEGRPGARDLLDERLAKGELSEEEYEHERAALEGRARAAHHESGKAGASVRLGRASAREAVGEEAPSTGHHDGVDAGIGSGRSWRT